MTTPEDGYQAVNGELRQFQCAFFFLMDHWGLKDWVGLPILSITSIQSFLFSNFHTRRSHFDWLCESPITFSGRVLIIRLYLGLSARLWMAVLESGVTAGLISSYPSLSKSLALLFWVGATVRELAARKRSLGLVKVMINIWNSLLRLPFEGYQVPNVYYVLDKLIALFICCEVTPFKSVRYKIHI